MIIRWKKNALKTLITLLFNVSVSFDEIENTIKRIKEIEGATINL